jgi:class 3 adenylate cyclase/TolB-like protein
VSADVVGYSRLMGRDESGTVARLKAHRRELIDPKIAEHHGRIVKTTGDGLLLECPSVVDAVRGAVEVQRGMAERNVGTQADQRIEFRFGINVGDIIIDGDDIFGDGVNVAARLQALATPGGIYVSKVVRDQVLDKLSFTFEDLGAQCVKNIARPVEIFRVVFENVVPRTTSPAGRAWRSLRRLAGPRWLAGAAIALGVAGFGVGSLSHFWKATSAVAPPPLSIAILPFVTPAGDATERQLADAFARDLASAFERSFRPARVTSPSLAATYRDKPLDVRTLGRELNVRYLVEGEIRRAGDRRVIDAKLVDTDVATQTWSDRLQIEESQLRQGGGRLAARLAIRLGDALFDAEIRRARALPSPGASAMDLWLHGYAVWARDDNTLSGALEARKWFDQALRLDADFAPALQSRVRTLEYELDLDPRAEVDRLLSEMDELTFRAVGIDPNSSRAWQWRADALWRQWRWDAALEAIAKSEQLGRRVNGRSITAPES